MNIRSKPKVHTSSPTGLFQRDVIGLKLVITRAALQFKRCELNFQSEAQNLKDAIWNSNGLLLSKLHYSNGVTKQ